MKKGKKLNQRRTFSKEFKQEIVNDFESGKFTVLELCRLHEIHNHSVYKWIRQYSSKEHPKPVIVEMEKSSTSKLKAYEKRVKELEQIIGQKQIKIDFLEKVIDLSNKHYQTDLVKNFNT